MENTPPQFPVPSEQIRSVALASAELWQEVFDRLAQVQASQAIVEQNQMKLAEAMEKLGGMLQAALPGLDLGQLAPQIQRALPASPPTASTSAGLDLSSPPQQAFAPQAVEAPPPAVPDLPSLQDAHADLGQAQGAPAAPAPSWNDDAFPESLPTIEDTRTIDAYLSAEFGSFAVGDVSDHDEILHDLLGDDFAFAGPAPAGPTALAAAQTAPPAPAQMPGESLGAPPPPPGFEMPASSSPPVGAWSPAGTGDALSDTRPADTPPALEAFEMVPPPPPTAPETSAPALDGTEGTQPAGAGSPVDGAQPARNWFTGASAPTDTSVEASVETSDSESSLPAAREIGYSSVHDMAHDILATSASAARQPAAGEEEPDLLTGPDAPITPDFFTTPAHGERAGWRRIRFGR